MSTTGHDSSSDLVAFKKPFSLLVSINGSLAGPGHSVGGGDIVIFKFIHLSKLNPDLLIPKTALPFVTTQGRLFITQSSFQPTLIGIVSLYLIRIIQGIWKAITNHRRYDIALSASPFSVDIIPIWLWKARHKGAIIYHLLPERKAVNLTTRVRFAIAALEQRLTIKMLRWACDFLVAGNDFTRQQLQALLPGKPIFILPAGFDAEIIDRISQPAKEPDLACFVGRLVSQKGIFDLLKIMEIIRHKNPALRLVIAGTGPEQKFLEAEIARLKLKNIELAGFVSEEQKFTLLKQAAYFFFPSYEEGWGIALAEALYCECRCICYELPHYRSIFGDFPKYAKPGDPESFARAFFEGGPVSSEQKKFLRQYDDPLVVRQLVNHLNQVAREKS